MEEQKEIVGGVLDEMFQEFPTAMENLQCLLAHSFCGHLLPKFGGWTRGHPAWRRVVDLYRYVRFGCVVGKEEELVHYGQTTVRMLMSTASLKHNFWNSLLFLSEMRYKLASGESMTHHDVAKLCSITTAEVRAAAARGELLPDLDQPTKLIQAASAKAWMPGKGLFRSTWVQEV